MDFDKVVSSRVSTRKFLQEEVSQKDLEKLIDACNKSPIAVGQYEKCQLLVIRNKEIFNLIEEEYKEVSGNNHNPLFDAPVLFLFVSSKDDSQRYEDCGCVLENLCLKATDLSLGSCYIRGAISRLGKNARYIKKLELREGFYPVSGAVVGKVDHELIGKDHQMEVRFID